LIPTRGNPDWHIQGDVIEAVKQGWDLIILHPPCTALCLSGNAWYGTGMKKHAMRLEFIEWTVKLWETACENADRVALENPTGVIWDKIPVNQWIHPWEHGHGETKKTGLALHNLPPLMATDLVSGREQRLHRLPPGPNRARERSQTFSGIARAFADQWG
jgi:hypothetical protein